MYARNQMTEELIKQRIVEQVDTKRLERITNSTLEGLAKRELNLSAIIGKSAEAKERRLVPEVIEEFFTQAAPISGVQPKETRENSHVYRLGKVPRPLWPVGERLEPRFGKLGREYQSIVFDKELLKRDPTLEWVTPGHPLFEAVREDVTEHVHQDLEHGAVFFDLHHAAPYRLDTFTASIKDGLGNQLHRRLFVVQAEMTGTMSIRQPTIFLDLALAPKGNAVPDGDGMPDQTAAERFLISTALNPFLTEVAAQRVTPQRRKREPQMDLFKVLQQADEGGTTFGETKVQRQGATVLDRIHQSMILFAAGRGEALKRFLVEDGAGRDQRYWQLAQALSALYPSQTEEKRWVDGVLARKKGLGF